MRTTLDIDTDVLHAVKDRARRQRRSAGAVLSELARESLTRPGTDLPVGSQAFFGFDPLPHRGRTVSNALIEQLRDDE